MWLSDVARGLKIFMKLKRVIFLLSVLCVVNACASSKVAPTPPPSQEQTPPPAPQTSTPSAPAPVTPDQNTTPAPLPSPQEMTHSYESAFIRMLITLIGLILLIFVTFWILRRLKGGRFRFGGSQAIDVLEKKAISQKTILYLIRAGNKKVLLSESQLEVRAVATFEETSGETD